MLPSYVRVFFWDVDPGQFDPLHYPEYTIARILEFGDEPAIRWMRENFSASAIEAVLRSDSRLSRKTAAFWALVFGVPPREVPALALRPEEQ
jgi:nitrogen fixation-related uncharacterized protein